MREPAALRELAAAIEALHEQAFFERMLDWATALSGADGSMVLLYEKDARPRVLADRLAPEERPHLYGDYLAGVFRLSPFYRLGDGLAVPVVASLRHIAPEGFRQSEYFRRYFGLIGVSDLVGILVPLPGSRVVHLSLGRSAGARSFSSRERGALDSWLPLVAAVIRAHFRTVPSAGPVRLSPGRVLLAGRGLTAREREIAEAILAGHSVKASARLLGISAETVRVHRKNLYAKLGIASQGELFSLFLASLREGETAG